MQLSIFVEYSVALETIHQHAPLDYCWRHGVMRRQANATDALALQQFGLASVTQYPLACLLMQAEEVSPLSQSQYFIVEAVSYLLQRDSVVLADIPILHETTYADMTGLLNTHFAQDDISFIESPSQQFWYLGLPENPVQTFLPQQALQQDVHGYQPTGEGARQLKQIMTEAQMLLHMHAINTSREARGLLPINSIWLHGNGELPTHTATIYDAAIGQAELAKALSQHCKMPNFATLDAWLQQPTKHGMMWLSNLADVDWVTLHQRLKRRQIKQLDLYIPIGNQTLQCTITSLDCWKFWQSKQSFEKVLGSTFQ